jgi:hypothetical protein
LDPGNDRCLLHRVLEIHSGQDDSAFVENAGIDRVFSGRVGGVPSFRFAAGHRFRRSSRALGSANAGDRMLWMVDSFMSPVRLQSTNWARLLDSEATAGFATYDLTSSRGRWRPRTEDWNRPPVPEVEQLEDTIIDRPILSGEIALEIQAGAMEHRQEPMLVEFLLERQCLSQRRIRRGLAGGRACG